MYYFFYIPVGTEARVRGTPWGTIALACANVGAFLFFRLAPGFGLSLTPAEANVNRANAGKVT